MYCVIVLDVSVAVVVVVFVNVIVLFCYFFFCEWARSYNIYSMYKKSAVLVGFASNVNRSGLNKLKQKLVNKQIN